MQLLKTILAASVMLALLVACGGSKTVVDQKQREQAASYNMQLGADYFRTGNLPLAKEKLERALEQDPNNPQTHMMLGLLYQRLGENDKADSQFSRSLSLDSKNSELRNSYGTFLCSVGKYERGEKLLLESATDQLYKSPAASYLNAGYCARANGNIKRAEEHFRQALKVQPKFAPAMLELADMELKQEQPLKARAFLERYIAAAPTNATSLWLGVRIERALGNQQQAGDYARRLRNDFPTSDETRQLLESERPAPKSPASSQVPPTRQSQPAR